MVEIINSLEDLCRLCAGKIDVLMGFHIFAADHRQIFKKICLCLPIQVAADDEFPKMVCVECACKLDIMFDFRERSILTSHIFSGMLSVNSSDVLTVDHSIIISNEESNGDLSQLPECKPAKDDIVKLEDSTNVCSETEDVSSVLEDKRYLTKVKTRHKERIEERKVSELELESLAGDAQESILFNGEPDEKKIVYTCDSSVDITVFSQVTVSNAELAKGEVVFSLVGEPDKQLDWYVCNACSKTFTHKEELERHTKQGCKREVSDSGQKPLRRTGRRVKTLKVKEEERKNNGGKTCSECGKHYPTNYKLQEHMRKHTGEKPFSCSYQNCKKAFRSKIGLAQHEANHSGQFEYSCPTCGKGFQCKSYLVVHQRVHSDIKPFCCKQCSRKFKTKQSLLDHMNRHLGVKPYLCDICGRGFITKGLCKSHQKVHSGTDNRQYPCHVCRKLFVSKSYLNTHFRIHTGEKPFMCEVCGKGFLTRVDLRIHSTMHTGEKSYVCETCGKAFARRDALRCHRRSHTGERPYCCEFCGQSFTQFSPMAIHKRLHTGERPYECTMCRKTFVSRSSMLAHQRKLHPSSQGAQFQMLEVQVEGDDLNLQDEPSEELIVVEDSPHLLSALNKTRAVAEMSPVGKLRDIPKVTVE